MNFYVQLMESQELVECLLVSYFEHCVHVYMLLITLRTSTVVLNNVLKNIFQHFIQNDS